ncbi:hypothetical protein CHLNCDRAFT_141980 [Chlorella variabilis]|uniref:Uncharacterized protein n=1 Tax=Chlorella variabilis TaxID=554065 RepID=E1Z7G5_CHLVA|nr:hypothetical protein CHLNCDRAFT_141980 [Chlorella variabilis]EFN57915.1 hypothetical protein CHLNCDRAFT_141980 [Chlorella variabilis]|eukprot:XP_005850017.1 hypothetical protein CHLNCDRAFT_141980 [Chlorella variabilis]
MAAAAPQDASAPARDEGAARLFGPEVCGKQVRVHCVEFEGVGLHWRMQLMRLQHERFQLLGEDGLVQAEYRDGLLVQQEGRQAAGLQPAQQGGSVTIIDVLEVAGADLAAHNNDGRTPRDVALKYRLEEAAQRLLDLEQQLPAAVQPAALPPPMALAHAAIAESEAAAAAPPAVPAAAVPTNVAPAAVQTDAAIDFGPELAGRHIRVWWGERHDWVAGTVKQCIMPDRVQIVRFQGVGPEWTMQRVLLQHVRFQLLREDGQVQAEYHDGVLVQRQDQQEGAGLQQEQQMGQRSGSRGSGERNQPGAVSGSGRQGQPLSGADAAAAASGLRRLHQEPATAAAAAAAHTASTAKRGAMAVPPPQQQQGAGKRQQHQEQPADKRQRQGTSKQAAEREYAALQWKAFDAAELNELAGRYLAQSEKRTDRNLRSGRAVPCERVTNLPPPVQSWGPRMGMSAEALNELQILLSRHHARDAAASRHLLSLLRVLECWLAHPDRPQPEVLVRLGRPLGWRPPLLPLVSGVEIVSQGAAGSDKPEPSFLAGSADGDILGVRIEKEGDQRWNVKQEVQRSG